MARTIKVANKNINLPLLREELDAAPFPPRGFLMAGFEGVGDGQYEPNATREAIGSRTDPEGGPDIVIMADPGELYVKTATMLTGGQNNRLDNVLAAHDATQQTAEQGRDLTDTADFNVLLNALQNWNTLTNAQKDMAQRRALRLLLREVKSGTDA